MEKHEFKELKERLLSARKNGYDRLPDGELAAMETYCAAYKAFLDAGKTERLCAAEAIRLAEAAGYRPYIRGTALSAGDKVYVSNRGKSVLLARIGKRSLAEGCQITAAHIDSPRLDTTAASANTSGSPSPWSSMASRRCGTAPPYR